MIEQGDIIITNFPFSDRLQYKERPAVVISNQLVNTSGDVIAVAVSSSENNQHKVLISVSDIIEGGTNFAQSFVHCDKIQRLNRVFSKGSVAKVSAGFLEKVIQKIQDYLKIEEKKG